MNIFSIVGCTLLTVILLIAGLVVFRIGQVRLRTSEGTTEDMTIVSVSKRQSGKKLKFIGECITCFCVVLFGVYAITTILAFQHGMQSDDLTERSLFAIMKSTAYSPAESNLSDASSLKGGDIIIYFKFGCSDCEAVYADLKAALADVDDVYWISSQSTIGQELLETYVVEEVPSGVYIRNDTLSGNVPYSRFVLYTADENGDTVLYTDESYGLGRLLSMKEANK